MTSRLFKHERKGKYLELYYEDEYIALDTGTRSREYDGHEILLDSLAVDALIEALKTMKTTIATRTKGLTS